MNTEKIELGDEIQFIQDVECEVYAKKNQTKGKPEPIKKGEIADVFSVPAKGGKFYGVQFWYGSTAWVHKKFIKKIVEE